MASCIYCGRTGYSLKVDRLGRCPECATEIRRREAEDAHRAGIYRNFKKSLELSTIPEKIAHYEKLLKRYAKEPGIYDYLLKLSEFYHLNGQNDRAWGTLNRAHMDAMQALDRDGNVDAYRHTLSKIKWHMHEILNDEGKYLEAVLALSGYYYLDAKYPDHPLNANAYIRRAGVIARKGGLKTANVREIATQIDALAGSHRDLSVFEAWFKQYLAKMQISEEVLM